MPRVEREGVGLSFEEAGQGKPPLLLIHAWGGDHTWLAPQHEHFSRRHRVVSPDLRGFGASDKPGQRYPIAGFADDLAWLCAKLGLEKPVVVGHSLGGTVALDLVTRHPELARALVILEAMVVPPPPIMESFAPALTGLHSPMYAEVLAQMGAQLIGQHMDAALRARLLAQMAASSPAVMISAIDELAAYDTAAAAAACKVPTLYIGTNIPYSDLARFRSLCPQLVTEQVIGGGHYFPLEVPDQVNGMIDRFIQLHAA